MGIVFCCWRFFANAQNYFKIWRRADRPKHFVVSFSWFLSMLIVWMTLDWCVLCARVGGFACVFVPFSVYTFLIRRRPTFR